MCIRDRPFEKDLKNEGFKTASQVQYVAIAGNFEDAGYKYDSSLSVLKIIFLSLIHILQSI